MDKQYWIGSGSYYFQAGNTSPEQFEGGNAGNGATRLEVADKYNIGLDIEFAQKG